MIVYVTVDGAPLDWSPAGEVELHLEDGSVVRTSVVPAPSTAAGRVGGGQVLRLAAMLQGALAAAIQVVVLHRGGVEIRITL